MGFLEHSPTSPPRSPSPPFFVSLWGSISMRSISYLCRSAPATRRTIIPLKHWWPRRAPALAEILNLQVRNRSKLRAGGIITFLWMRTTQIVHACSRRGLHKLSGMYRYC